MAVTSAHQREQVKKQQQIVRADETSTNIDAILAKKFQGMKAKQPASESSNQPQSLILSQTPKFVIDVAKVDKCGSNNTLLEKLHAVSATSVIIFTVYAKPNQ